MARAKKRSSASFDAEAILAKVESVHAISAKALDRWFDNHSGALAVVDLWLAKRADGTSALTLKAVVALLRDQFGMPAASTSTMRNWLGRHRADAYAKASR